jgi:hypothetical protein
MTRPMEISRDRSASRTEGRIVVVRSNETTLIPAGIEAFNDGSA